MRSNTFLGGIDANKDQEIRRILFRLSKIAEKYRMNEGEFTRLLWLVQEFHPTPPAASWRGYAPAGGSFADEIGLTLARRRETIFAMFYGSK